MSNEMGQEELEFSDPKPKKKGSEVAAEVPPIKVVPTTVEEEMKSSYIDYAMSVIVGRALPDVRDGLKPVHRRILYAMDELGLSPGKPYKKSARIVGEVLGKYHPHGDMAVYDSMVRMAQDFSLRYLLVDGQGNFGSVDGDAPAAMRYTEVRLSEAAAEMLADIDKETVNFGPNFDESLKEPLILPSKLPNLLVNGSSGIAVGMATNVPPHNLAETVDGISAVIDNPEATLEEIMQHIKGPDFPSGGMICGEEGIREAYSTGRGLLTLRAKASFEELKSGKEAIIVTEIPYQVNKAQLIEQIANLVKDKKITGIADLRDESDREGMRIYIELKRDASKEIVLNQLYKHTDMQVTFGVNTVVLVQGEPKLVDLKELISSFVSHREEVVTRRTKYELKKAEEEAHILEGLKICLKNIDAVVKLIRASKNPEEARTGLMEEFGLTKIQAQAILDMKLQRLTQLERGKIEEEYQNLTKLIAELKAILASRKRILGVIKEELAGIKKKFGDERKTEIVGPAVELLAEDLIPDIEVVTILTRDGFIKRMPVMAFRAQHRGGRGVTGMTTREEDVIENIFTASTHSFVLFFTSRGKVYRLKVYEIPEAGRTGKGQAIANLLQLSEKEVVTAAIPVSSFEKDTFLFMATEKGSVKKTPLKAFANIRRTGIIAITLKEADELRWVRETDGTKQVILGTLQGTAIRFKETDVRPMGRAAAGVRGISLKKGDRVISMDIVEEGGELMVLTSDGFGKRTLLKHFRVQRRGGKGLTLIKLRKGDEVARFRLVFPADEIIVVTASGILSRQKVSDTSVQGRYARGVRVQRLEEKDKVKDFTRVLGNNNA